MDHAQGYSSRQAGNASYEKCHCTYSKREDQNKGGNKIIATIVPRTPPIAPLKNGEIKTRRISTRMIPALFFFFSAWYPVPLFFVPAHSVLVKSCLHMPMYFPDLLLLWLFRRFFHRCLSQRLLSPGWNDFPLFSFPGRFPASVRVLWSLCLRSPILYILP